MEISYRKATEADIDFLLNLRKETMVPHLENQHLFLSEEQHLNRIRFHFEVAYIILFKTGPIGLVKYCETKKEIQLLQLQITPDLQGKGIGRKVLSFLKQQSAQKKKQIKLTVLKSNPAQALYQRFGFRITGEDANEFHMELPVQVE
ncbi:GNAT family N-acetyltransferase [Aquimarina hainanensis]|uniref:GNAT family N-acetyltransferase n=1 Tax=Aquimarina hainanensis TaxID=1578017 RepID=A0ABW5N948_9FLAO|nr:GNAT family N-acetyltransferase [Aquimarina sp. TRL1]QKX03858.1 GNAT family N-acetyltransferase [Aquimarina sp. TRL1]